MLTTEPKHIFEPNELACGQAVLAMLFDLDVFEVIRELQNERETTLKEMLDFVKKRKVRKFSLTILKQCVKIYKLICWYSSVGRAADS